MVSKPGYIYNYNPLNLTETYNHGSSLVITMVVMPFKWYFIALPPFANTSPEQNRHILPVISERTPSTLTGEMHNILAWVFVSKLVVVNLSYHPRSKANPP